MKKIALASTNSGKCRELNALFAAQGYVLLSQDNFTRLVVEETGLTFVENAIIKARHLARLSGLPTMADDSGIEVDALNGAPGIYSARYAGPDASDHDNMQRLLVSMQAIDDPFRTARFRCVMVLMRHAEDPCPLIAQGSWEGILLREVRGHGGFGYDPVFYVPTLGMSVAELPDEIKNIYSHRAQAVKALQNLMIEAATP
ncbi:MAG: dITP/XTP pyrophosphatase [Pseudomonadota bacterium]|jgi:XTP/dITP diphosphohydrolase